MGSSSSGVVGGGGGNISIIWNTSTIIVNFIVGVIFSIATTFKY